MAAEARFDDQLLAVVGLVELEEEYALAQSARDGAAALKKARGMSTEDRS